MFMYSLPTPSKTEVLVDYTNPVLDAVSGMFYSDVTIREWFTAEQLRKHKELQENVKAAELVRDSQAVIAKADEGLEWIGDVV